MFQCINQNAEQEELLDEKRRLCDVQPFSPDLKLVLKNDDVEDKVLNGNISHLIDKGISSTPESTHVVVVCLFIIIIIIYLFFFGGGVRAKIFLRITKYA